MRAGANDNGQEDGRHRSTQTLLCPDCGQKGAATLEENSRPDRLGPPRRVVGTSAGFHVEEGRAAPGVALVICNDCDAILDES